MEQAINGNKVGAPIGAGSVKAWIKGARPQFFTVTIVPIILGAAIAWREFGAFNWSLFALAMLGGLFAHAGVDLVNDYFDHTSGNDDINKHITPFNAGSRVIQEKLLRPKQVYYGSLVCFAISIVIGLYLNHVLPGNTILYIGLIGIFLSYFYSADPLRIGYTGFGFPAIATGFGPVMVLGSYYVQTQHLSLEALLASVPVGMHSALIGYVNSFADHDADKQAHKMTWTVTYGKQKAMKLFLLLLGITYIWIAVGVAFKVFPLFSLAVFLTLPLYIKAYRVGMAKYDDVYGLLPACIATILIQILYGVLFIASYIADKLAS